MIREKKSIDDAPTVREKNVLTKTTFETEHESVLSVMYLNPPKDIKSSYFRKLTGSKLVTCNVLWLMVEEATTKSYFA